MILLPVLLVIAGCAANFYTIVVSSSRGARVAAAVALLFFGVALGGAIQHAVERGAP